MEERREYPRYVLTVSVTYSSAENLKSDKAQSKNISNRGICFSTRTPMRIGGNVRITFSLAAQTIFATGRVVWTEQIVPYIYDNGIEFTSITDEHLKTIEKFIKI
jgi:hypothetical protein